MPEPASYGADSTGLVWGYHFRPGARTVAIDSDAALELLAHPFGELDGFLWLHFSLGTASCEPWLRRHLQLPEEFFELLSYTGGSTRIEQQDDSLIAVLNDVLFEFTFDPSNIATVYVCVQPQILVTVRPRPVRSIDRLRVSVRTNEFASPAALLAHLLNAQADVLVEIVRDSTTRIDAIEDGILQGRTGTRRAELGTLRRTLVRLQRLLAPEPAGLFRLLNRPIEWLSEDDLEDLRAAAEDLATAVGDSRAFIERVRLLQEELGAIEAERANRTLFILTLVTVLALPINLVAGLFGMNVGGIPLAEHSLGFEAIVVTLGLSTAAAGLLVMRALRR